MKILAIICEFNPFHNGHKYLLDKAKQISGHDAVLCIMSGSFTQRGDICIMDKHTRAKHAVLGGADCVIQLPSPFAVSPAEIFAQGAVKILSAIPQVSTIAFGCESGDKDLFNSCAKKLIDESGPFKQQLNKRLSSGESYVKSYSEAFGECGGDKQFISSPNNILGLEYTKAIMRLNADIDILPVKRVGSGYNDGNIKDNFSSASAIRQNLDSELIKSNLPDYVLGDLQNYVDESEFHNYLRHCLFNAQTDNLQNIFGCVEGLENKLLSLRNQSYDVIIKECTSKRYSSSRIKRILLANALKLFRSDCERFLEGNLFIKPLAIKKERADEILSLLAKSNYPVICGPFADNLTDTAKECFEKDCYEYEVFKHITKTENKDYMILV